MVPNEDLLARVEWEPLQSEQTWILVQMCVELPDGTQTFTAKRDASYHLEMAIRGRCSSKESASVREKLGGSYAPGELLGDRQAVTLQSRDGPVTIEGYLPKGLKVRHVDVDRVEFIAPIYAD